MAGNSSTATFQLDFLLATGQGRGGHRTGLTRMIRDNSPGPSLATRRADAHNARLNLCLVNLLQLQPPDVNAAEAVKPWVQPAGWRATLCLGSRGVGARITRRRKSLTRHLAIVPESGRSPSRPCTNPSQFLRLSVAELGSFTKVPCQIVRPMRLRISPWLWFSITTTVAVVG